MKPTTEMAQSLQRMFEHLNLNLFAGDLPPAMVVCTRNGKVVGGYHSEEQWENEAGEKVAEIGLNSNVIANGDPIEVIGILIHEMVHLWQSTHGKPSRTGYHNKEWAGKCAEIGLTVHCLDKGAKPDQVTGQNINTQIEPGGIAEMIVAQMSGNPELDFAWWTSQAIDIDDQGQPQAVPEGGEGGQGGGGGQGGQEPAQTPKKPGARTKFHCAECGLNAWAKHGASLTCGDCNRPMVAML